ncbi:MFS general substrate transporter [Marasmius fiardii PR-910]|nr:MFS general substrate transporter [Marasmius fiardii PR-910]
MNDKKEGHDIAIAADVQVEYSQTQTRVEVTEEDSRRILRKTDIHLLTILAWVYWLQILDKSVLGFAATFGLKTDARLVDNQYSTVGSMNAIAQLAWQPFSSYLLVRVKPRLFMSIIVFCWGVAMCGMAASTSYPALLASRFLLGLFEAACLPLFAILTSVWYRRSEQPMRVAVWYGTNGLGTIMAAIFSYGFGRINNPAIHTYQIIFLFCGLLTCVTAPYILWRLDNSVSEARFLSSEDRLKAVERLRANNTGNSATEKFKIKQAIEALFELKTWLFVAMTFLLNVGASVTVVFGPIILNGLGFDKFTTSLLNIPFGFVQIIIIGLASYAAFRWKRKSVILALLVLPVIVGLVLLYVHDFPLGVLLMGYYFLAFLFGANPLIVSWMTANTAGSTKRSVLVSTYNAASAGGNIAGPFLFANKDAPLYLPGLRAVLGIFVALIAVVGFQVVNLMFLSRLKERQRVQYGKPAKLHDSSMDRKFQMADADVDVHRDNASVDKDKDKHVHLGDNAFKDLTDKENDEFVYVY